MKECGLETYRGKKIEELDKEELVEALKNMYEYYEGRIRELYQIIHSDGDDR